MSTSSTKTEAIFLAMLWKWVARNGKEKDVRLLKARNTTETRLRKERNK